MRHILPFLLLFLEANNLISQAGYPVSDIPSGLLNKAYAVVRAHELRLEVSSEESAVETEHKVVTILHPSARVLSEVNIDYGPLSKVVSIEGAVYDADGTLFRKIKKDDITDFKPYEYFVDDTKAKSIEFPNRELPYTIEYTIVTRHHGLMHYPVFQPQDAPNLAVQHASFSLSVPEGFLLNIKELNMPDTAKKAPYRWELNSLPALEPEPYMPASGLPFPMILCSPDQFSFHNFQGSMSSWKSFGQFIHRLNQGRQDLPPETTAILRTITADCPDDRCKVERIYSYLQENTRYFFIGLGIGGWQPMTATEVDKNKYSDCKGLSNYMISMLQSVDIQAYYALIRAGESEQYRQFPDFPNCWFNHAMVCVPLSSDTLWLECTSQTVSAGFLSTFTDNRPALLITPEGGYITCTPHYDETVNTVHRQISIRLEADGSAILQSSEKYQGIAQNDISRLADMHAELQRKALYDFIGIKDFEVTSFQIGMKKGSVPVAENQMELSLPRYGNVSGKRIFVPAVVWQHNAATSIQQGERQYPVQADARGFTEEEQFSIQLPEGYRLENILDPVAYETVFGSYRLSVMQEQSRLIVSRKLVLKNTVLPREQFETLNVFLKNIAKADKTRLVLVKQT